MPTKKQKAPLTQRETWSCGMCPQHDYPSFSTAREMRVHAADVHNTPMDQTERLRKQVVLFADGANGYAQQVYNWMFGDGRMFATQVWEQGRFKD